MAKEKATPVKENEMQDIRVTLELDEGNVECSILCIYECQDRDYIALLTCDEKGNEDPEGEVYIYRYAEDAEGNPSLDNITDEEEYEAAVDRFDELLDEELYDSMED